MKESKKSVSIQYNVMEKDSLKASNWNIDV